MFQTNSAISVAFSIKQNKYLPIWCIHAKILMDFSVEHWWTNIAQLYNQTALLNLKHIQHEYIEMSSCYFDTAAVLQYLTIPECIPFIKILYNMIHSLSSKWQVDHRLNVLYSVAMGVSVGFLRQQIPQPYRFLSESFIFENYPCWETFLLGRGVKCQFTPALDHCMQLMKFILYSMSHALQHCNLLERWDTQ